MVWWISVLVCIGLIAVDQLLKHLAVQYLLPLGTAPLIAGIIQLKYVENDGAAFSILAGKQLFLIGITGLALAAIACVLLFRPPKGRLEKLAMLLVFSGGAGNLIDRVANGYVVDYFNFLFVQFAVFNFADVLVCAGGALLAVAVYRAERREKRGAGKPAGVPPKAENADAED